MAHELVKIVPRAANAFRIEVYDYLGNLVYTLRIHTDGERMQILPENAQRERIILKAVSGYSTDKQQEMNFSVLNIQPLAKEKQTKEKTTSQ